VVVPLYNKQAYVRRCVDSVLSQTFGDFELIIVDDGSTDESADIASAYHDSRIRLIRQANGGVSVARNRGIAEARGKWVAFLDADDEWLPRKLEKVADCAAKFPQAGAIYGRTAQIKGGQQIIPAAKTAAEPLLVDYLSLVTFDGPAMNSSSTAIRADVFNSAGTFPEGVKITEDLDMWLRVACTTEVVHIPEVLSIYHLDAGESNWQYCRDWEPYWISTYKRWLMDGRIPQHLIRAAEAYHQSFLLARSIGLALEGRRLAALWSLAREIQFRSVPKVKLLKALRWLCLPAGLVRSLKRLVVFANM